MARVRILLKRVYEDFDETEVPRILVERLWPRGLSKTKAGVDLWLKQIGPSHELRKWFAHDHSKWEEFKLSYFKELENNLETVEQLNSYLIKYNTCFFVFASREEQFNNAVALKEFLQKRSSISIK